MSRINPGDFLDEAKTLSDSAEARHSVVRRRTIVGRAYYAAYHACLSTALQIGYDPDERLENEPPTGVHGHLIRWLARFNHRTVQGLGRELGRLKGFRASADYDRPYLALTIGDAESVLKTAERLVQVSCPSAITMLCPAKAESTELTAS